MPVDLRQDAAREYRRAARRRGRVSSAVSVAVLLAYAAVADQVPGGGAAVAAVGVILVQLAGLPVDLIGHAASRRAGLSVQKTASWLADRGKAAVLVVVFAGLFGAGVVAAQRTWPDAWPAVVWCGQVGLSAVATVVVPVLVLPLFLRSAPLGGGPLRDMAEDLVRACGLRVRDIRVLRMSAKTTASNAMVVGAGPTRRILLSDTLVGDGGDVVRLAETRAVLAHELGHHAHRDLARLLAAGAITAAFTWVVATPLFTAMPVALRHGGAGDAAALPALVLAYGAVAWIVGFADAWYSRGREREADRYACRMAGGDAMACALERLVATNLSELTPPPFEQMRSSHPAPGDRIAAARGKESPS